MHRGMIKYSIFICILPFLLFFVRREGGERGEKELDSHDYIQIRIRYG